jgi:glycosyltransferase involved in cell wall biosynthesis
MKLSVVVPCWNAVNTIAVQLDALCHQQWRGGWEVIVADNGSTDGTQQLVESYYGRLPGLRLIDASDRRGAAHARNNAAKIATGDALVYCDADDEVGIGWLTAIGNALQTHDFVVSRMDVDKLNPPWLALTLNNVQGREIRRAYYPPYLRHAGSSGMAVRKILHDRVGGFDETLREREDTDYCFRIQLLGCEMHFVADATIHIRYNERGEVLFHQARRWASYQALLYKRYGAGMPLDRPWASYFKTWRDLLACLPRVFDRQKRPAWMKTLGTQVGLLQGAILYQVSPVCETLPMEKAMMEALMGKLMDPAIAPTCPAGDFPTTSSTQKTEPKSQRPQ